MSPLEVGLLNLKVFAALVWKRFNEDRCMAIAASLSYTSLLALVPLMAISFAVLAAFPVFDDIQEQIKTFIFANFLPEAVDTVQQYLDRFLGAARGVTAIGVIGLAVTALLLFVTIEGGMNEIFRVSRPRSIVTRLLVFWAILTLGPLIMGTSFSLATLVYAFAESLGVDEVRGGLAMVARFVPPVLAIIAFAIFYVIIPSRPVKFSHALIGAVIAGVVFAALRSGFAFYITRFPTYQTLYGALATIPIFLFWMYLSWAVVLIGAIVTATLPEWGRRTRIGQGTLEPSDLLILALTLLAELYRGAERGGGLKRRQLLSVVHAVSDATVDAMLERLRREHFVDITAHGRWLPARNPSSVDLHELMTALGLEIRIDAVADDAYETAQWKPRLEAALRHDTEKRRDSLGISLRSLLLDDEAPSEESSLSVVPGL
ncbi:MAG: YihY family inner membrane protein [Rhodospirillales bacterium]|nr:YihY family inner membrane protein [Rhodospirillales bacterium]